MDFQIILSVANGTKTEIPTRVAKLIIKILIFFVQDTSFLNKPKKLFF